MEIAPGDARKLASIVIVHADATEEERSLAELTMLRSATFEVGDCVRWHESTDHPHNRGIVEDIIILGFPEWTGRPTIGYQVLFPSAEGVGYEDHMVAECDLRYYEGARGVVS